MSIDPATFRDLLLQRLSDLDEQDRITASDRDPVALDQESVGRLSRIDAMQVQAMALAQERRRKSERAAIAAALQRIEEGEFGYCIGCGDEIAEGRLRNSPTVVKCLECAAEST
ncbi:TraR/DksA C4-type zinc finger protein [Croceicoccus sp. YJ47]|uniref:TraR/DksA family transcriptional regulator n=1 Tax=Croceicoccus sp. YJ47 TaxID=2798724 RepID=UPI00192418E2|nr:TraR/DksA C4-type zinc finger protein [Croceicoccus sp. YJ47]QQN74909.1 TraR/DksA C4-type zinc finger protein [Croceicoccus sp. YJ47]